MKNNTTKITTEEGHLLTRKNQHPSRSTPYKLKSQSTQFLSKAQRFHYEYSQNPGPGSYEPPLRQRHTSDYHINRNQSEEAVSQQHMWIISRGRQLFDTLNHWKANLGPGKYHKNKQSKEQDHSGWSKNVRFNYDKTERKTHVGPGTYKLGNTLINNKLVACSAFNSKSTKSHIDDLVKNKIKLHEKKLNPEYDFEKINQEVSVQANNDGSYERIKKKNNGSPIFMSKIDRLPKIQAEKVGPGSYDLDVTFRKEVKRRVHTDIKSSPSRQYIMLNHESSKVISPGPGSYNIDKTIESSPSKNNKKPLLGLISRQSRFKSSNLSDRHLQTEHKEPSILTGSQRQHSNIEFQNKNSLVNGSGIKNVYTILRRIQKQKQLQQKILKTQPQSQH